MDKCIFCSIISGETDARVVYKDEQVIAFWDHHAAAPVHILIVPIKHINSVNSIQKEDEPLVGHLIHVARELAVENGVSQTGYRLVINTGPDARQSVPHLHVHLLGGKGIPSVL